MPLAGSIVAASLLIGVHPGTTAASPPSLAWSDRFRSAEVTDYPLGSLVVDEDGDGPGAPVLIVYGLLTTAGGIPINHVGRWDGSAWTALGDGFDAHVSSVVMFDDDGAGPDPPALYAAGAFLHSGEQETRHLARWDGVTWQEVGGGLSMEPNQFGYRSAAAALCVVNEASGPTLYVGGAFDTAGSTPASGIARWDGKNWSALGSGVSSSSSQIPAAVYSISWVPEGEGGWLCAGGYFNGAGGVPVNTIARWDGANWSALGDGLGTINNLEYVYCTAVYDSGDGPTLYAAGNFFRTGAQTLRGIGRWDGAAWQQLGSGVNTPNANYFTFGVFGLNVLTEGGVARLVVTGAFVTADGLTVNNVAAWDGWAWSALGGGVTGAIQANGRPTAVGATRFDPDGDGPRAESIVVTGAFTSAGAVAARNIAAWDGASWTALAGNNGLSGEARAMCVFGVAGTGEAVLVTSGAFARADEHVVNRIAAWDGSSFGAFGAGFTGGAQPNALLSHDDGSGSALYVGGDFQSAGGVTAFNIARWDGSTWSDLQIGIDSSVHALAQFDEDGAGPGAPALFAGGQFSSAGAASALSVARWDGAAWSALEEGVDGVVFALVAQEQSAGTLPRGLYVGGLFNPPNAFGNHVQRWDGNDWTALGGGVNGRVRALQIFDDGLGPALYVGGDFTIAGGQPAERVARWNGLAWSALGTGVGYAPPDSVRSLVVFDPDGAAGPAPPALYVGGSFAVAGGYSAENVARWDGHAWMSLPGEGVHGVVHTMAVFDDDGVGGAPAALFLGGAFTSAGGVSSSRIARLGAETAECFGDANGDGIVSFADLNIVLSQFGQSGAPGTLAGDVNDDGFVNFTDLNIVLGNFGIEC